MTQELLGLIIAPPFSADPGRLMGRPLEHIVHHDNGAVTGRPLVDPLWQWLRWTQSHHGEPAIRALPAAKVRLRGEGVVSTIAS